MPNLLPDGRVRLEHNACNVTGNSREDQGREYDGYERAWTFPGDRKPGEIRAVSNRCH